MRIAGPTPRSIVRCLTAVAALVLADGCGAPKDEHMPDGRLVIDYWEKWTGFEGEAMQAVVDDYNASQSRVFVRKLTVSEINRKLMLATAGGNPPDVAGIWSSGLADFAEKNALLPLDTLLREAGIGRTNYIPVFWDTCSHRGFVWALPSTPATVALHWNKALFREAGLDPMRPPRSLTELDAMAERLTIMEKLNLAQLKFSPLAELSASFVTSHPNPCIQLFIDLARSPNARTVPRTSIWTAYNEELRVAADRVLALQATPAEALHEVQRRMQPKFDRLWQRWDLVKDERLATWGTP